jgi:hypothetical protein
MPKLKVTEKNFKARIENAISIILACWDNWDAEAQEAAQQSQDADAWDDSMFDNLEVVLSGVLFDECLACGGTGGVDSGGVRPDGKSIDVPCPECFPDDCE